MTDELWEPMPGAGGWYEIRREGQNCTALVLVLDFFAPDGYTTVVFFPAPLGSNQYIATRNLEALAAENLLWKGPLPQFCQRNAG